MNYRSSEILASESIATAGTKTIDVNLIDPISRIMIQVKLTGNGSTPTAHPAKAISKIEIIDGSNVIYSLSGVEAQAMDYYDTRVEPYNNLTYLNDVMTISVFNLNFGRELWDEELALDPRKFANLQLKITHNLASGGCAPDAATMRIRADVFDEKVPSLKGYLASREHWSVADTSSQVDYCDLPTDHVLRKLIIQGNADDKYPYEQANQVKLSEEHDKRVVFEGYVSDFIKYICASYPPYQEFLRGATSAAAVSFYVTPTYETMLAAIADDNGAAYINVDQTAGQLQSVAASAAVNFTGVVRGWCPHGAVVFPFGKQGVINDWYDVARLSSLQLKLTQGSSVSGSESIYVLTQQLRSY